MYRDIVALVLACTVFIFVLGTVVLRAWLYPEMPADPVAWQALMGVIVGVLAAYVTDGRNTGGPKL